MAADFKRHAKRMKPKGGAARRLKSERPLPTTSNCPATNRSDGRLYGYVMEPLGVSKKRPPTEAAYLLKDSATSADQATCRGSYSMLLRSLLTSAEIETIAPIATMMARTTSIALLKTNSIVRWIVRSSWILQLMKQFQSLLAEGVGPSREHPLTC
ncbi:MAG TPA: hypothetical protein VHN11_13850 [Xanthobacteraceae bacterium]|nr:hypothetical protein [Xanthobacteraceae bacterium]